MFTLLGFGAFSFAFFIAVLESPETGHSLSIMLFFIGTMSIITGFYLENLIRKEKPKRPGDEICRP